MRIAEEKIPLGEVKIIDGKTFFGTGDGSLELLENTISEQQATQSLWREKNKASVDKKPCARMRIAEEKIPLGEVKIIDGKTFFGTGDGSLELLGNTISELQTTQRGEIYSRQ